MPRVCTLERGTLLTVAINARYVHTNLIAKNWRSLAAFYVNVFGCVPVPPERDYRGATLDALTGLENAHQRGVHLRLPGHGEDGPTLEVFELTPDATGNRAINAHGFGHIAFEVPDVAAAQRAVLEVGGTALGEVVTLTRSDGWRVTACYVTDPEGNAVELQAWSAPTA